jgi:hypothetical protein
MYPQIPQGFEIYYQKGTVLNFQQTIYGLKQAAFSFQDELFAAFNAMGFKRSSADPYLHFKNSEKIIKRKK